MVILSILTLLGMLGLTGIGKAIYNFMKLPLGDKVWLAPMILLLIALIFYLVPGFMALVQDNRDRPKRKVRTQKALPAKTQANGTNGFSEELGLPEPPDLPQGKLVSLKGFEEYFSNPYELEPMEPLAELEDLGEDFETYFREGQEFSIKPIGTRLTNLKGFESYFQEVDQELAELKDTYKNNTSSIKDIFEKNKEQSIRKDKLWQKDEKLWQKNEKPEPKAWENTYYSSVKDNSYIPGQVSQLVNESFSSEGLSQAERSVLLGKEKPMTDFGKLGEIQEDLPQEEVFKKEVFKEEVFREISQEAVFKKEIFSEKVEDVVELEEVAELEEVEETVEVEALMEEVKENPFAKSSQEDFSEELTQEKQYLGISPQEGFGQRGTSAGELKEMATKEIASTLAIEEEPFLEKREREAPKGKRKNWILPSIDLLEPAPKVNIDFEQDTQKNLEKILKDFGVSARVIRVARGPVITRYELAPAPGVKISRIVNLADDIALGLAARDVRIEAPIPGKSAIGIEVPNKNPRPVPFREVIETPEFKEGKAKLRFALGKDIGNQPIVANLAKMPHLLVAGATGSGKSVCVTGIINSFLFNATPQEVKFLMVDPKMVELSIYNGIPHLLAPVVTDPKKASGALKWVVKEMETRYELFAASGVRDIERYNLLKAQEEGRDKDSPPALPWIVVVIDELADLMMVAATEVEEAICRLAQMARAAGIHLIIATQRPSVDVITGLIKANIPSRISFAVSSQIDSRTILDSTGAEKLLGRGDMLYSPQGLNKPVRVQGCLITDDEVQRIIDHWKAQGSPEYLDPEKFDAPEQNSNIEGGGVDDELFFEAGHLIITTGMASVSFLQRKLKLGYARAARLIDLLEDNGVVGGYEGNKPRQVLLTLEEFQERFGSL